MDDPWATWGKPKADPMRMTMSSPPPEDLDVADPWAPTKAKAANLVASGQTASAAAFASAKEGFGAARERFGPAAANAGASAAAFMGSAKERMAGVDYNAKAESAAAGLSSGLASMGSGLSAMTSKMSMPSMEGVSSGFSSMSAKLPSKEEMSAGFSSASSKASAAMPDMEGVSSGFSSGLSSVSTGFSSMASKVNVPDMSGMKMPSMSVPKMEDISGGFSASSPPAVPSVEAPTFSVPTSITSSLSSFQSKVQGAATTALAGHLASQAPPTVPAGLATFASNAIAANITSQASDAVTARASAAAADATARANAYTSGLSSTLNSNISAFNSNVSALSSAANTASSMAQTVGPNIGGLGSLPSVPVSLPSWGDAWGSPTQPKEEVRPPTPVRSPSPPEAFGNVWDAPAKEERSPSPTRSVRSTHSVHSVHSARSLSPARSLTSSPRKSLEARLSRELSLNLSFERRGSGSRPTSPLKEAAVPVVPDIPDIPAIPDLPDIALAAPSPLSATVFKTSFADAAADISTSSLGVASAVNTSMRRSPSFGSDFGGFNDGDAWGGSNAADSSWKKDDWGTTDSYGGAAEGYESWGGVRTATPPAEPTAQEQQWAAAQRAIKIKEERAPFEKISKLKREWDEVAASVIAEKDKLETLDEAEEKKLDDGVKVLEEHVNETLRTLTELPDTRIPPLHTLTTHQKYSSVLSRANANPSTSLLHMPIRPRRFEGLSFGPGLEGTWGDRSRLGESEAEVAAAAASPEEAAPSRWSFWKKPAAPKPLVTSGGGMLEVKTPSSITSPATPQPPEVAAAIAASAAANLPARASISGRGSISSAPRASSSRPASPALPPPIIPPVAAAPAAAPAPAAATDIFEDIGHETPRHSLGEPEAQAAPSGVSRFFGRWGRRSTTPSTSDQPQEKSQSQHRPQPSTDDVELTSDDFTFLAEVPTMAPNTRGTGDLLGFGGPPTIDSVLQSSSSSKLPSPLAPPPRGPAGRPPARQSTFVARMAGPKTSAPSNMDLLSGLDFDMDASPAASTPPAQSRSSSIIGWDDILAPSSSSARGTPAIAPPPRNATPPVLAPPPRVNTPPLAPAQRTATPPILPAPAQHQPVRPLSPLSATSPASSSARASPLGMGSMGSMASALPSISMAPMVPSPTSQPKAGMSTPILPGPPRVTSPANYNSPISASTPSAPLMPSMKDSLSVTPGSSVGGLPPALSPAPLTGTTGTPISANPLLGASTGSVSRSPAAGDWSFTSTTTMASGQTSTPLMRPGGLPSGGLATPLNLSTNVSGMSVMSPSSVASPGMDAPLLSATGPRTPAHKAPQTLSTPSNDDFGDFSDFADFAAAPTKSTPAAASEDFDDFGDFGDFTAFESPAPPPVPSKTPWSAPRSGYQHGSPAPTPPSKSPYTSTAATRIRPPPAPSFSSPTPPNRRQPSVDHTPALSLLNTANKSPGRWPAPQSPVAPAIPPPAGFFPPPPGGKAKTVNLLDFDD